MQTKIILEDEFHFILECPLYTELRKNVLRNTFGKYRIYKNVPKLIALLNTENEIEIRNLSMYNFKAFNFQNNILYN